VAGKRAECPKQKRNKIIRNRMQAARERQRVSTNFVTLAAWHFRVHQWNLEGIKCSAGVSPTNKQINKQTKNKQTSKQTNK
jgi:hypothetical protein